MYKYVLSPTSASHVTHMKESAIQWVMKRQYNVMPPVIHSLQSCHTHKWVTSQMRISHVMPYKRIMSRIKRSHFTFAHESSCHTWEQVPERNSTIFENTERIDANGHAAANRHTYRVCVCLSVCVLEQVCLRVRVYACVCVCTCVYERERETLWGRRGDRDEKRGWGC